MFHICTIGLDKRRLLLLWPDKWTLEGMLSFKSSSFETRLLLRNTVNVNLWTIGLICHDKSKNIKPDTWT